MILVRACNASGFQRRSLPQTAPASGCASPAATSRLTKSCRSRMSGLRQRIHSPASCAHGFVLPGSEAGVLRPVDHPEARFVLTQDLLGPVGRGVVEDDDLKLAIVLSLNRGQALAQMTSGIPGDDGDRNHTPSMLRGRTAQSVWSLRKSWRRATATRCRCKPGRVESSD